MTTIILVDTGRLILTVLLTTLLLQLPYHVRIDKEDSYVTGNKNISYRWLRLFL